MAPFSIFSPHLPCQSRDLWCVQSSKRATRASSHGTRKLLVPPVQSPRMSSPRSMEFTAWQHGRHWGLPHHTPRMLFKFLLIHIVLFVFFFFLKQEDHIFFAQQSRLDWPSHLLEMSFPVSFCIFTLLCCYAYAMLIYVNHYSIFVGWYSMLHSVVVLSLTSTYHSISLQQSAWIILLNSQNRCKLSIVITKRGRRYALIG